MELTLQIQRLSDQVERLLSDANSEKTTRRESFSRIYNKLNDIDIMLRGADGKDGLMSRVKQLEISHAEIKERGYNTFNRWTVVIALIISVGALLISAFK